MLSIIDYGLGNLGSLLNIYQRLGIDARIASKSDEIRDSSHLILPGVGAFDEAMEKLNASGLRHALEVAVIEEKTPILGICLGMQIMARSSEEGKLRGLEWIDAEVKKISVANGLKVPHIGWNMVRVLRPNAILEREDFNRFYFLHSYYIDCENPVDLICEVEYGQTIGCAISKGNICGVQFHPEKSHNFGKEVLRKFAEM